MESVIEIWQGVFGIGSWQRKKAKIESGKFKVMRNSNEQVILDLDLSQIKLKFTNNNDLEFIIFHKDDTHKFRVSSKKILLQWRDSFKQEITNKIRKMKIAKSMKNLKQKDNSNLIHDLKVLIQHKAFQKILIQMQKLQQIQQNLQNNLPNQIQLKNEKFFIQAKIFNNECNNMMDLLQEEISCLENMKQLFMKKIEDPIFIKQLEKNQYKTALEQLIEEKSLQNEDNISQVSLNDTNSNETIYYSLEENSVEFNNFKQHFKRSHQVDIEQDIKFIKQDNLNPKTYKLISTSTVFQKYAVQNNQQNIRTHLGSFREKELKIDLWKLFKDNIGRDLTKITMPVYLNEPLSLLQKNAEAYEYREYFQKANNCDDVLMRMVYVTAGLFMKFSTVLGRVKKPFNPLLGETFEYQEGDFKLFMEQVNHHPPILCYYAESDDFILEGFIQVKLKFSLKGFSIKQLGKKKLYLKKVKETYDFSMPESAVYNLIFGDTYIWHIGSLIINNLTNGVSAEIVFPDKGWSSKDDYKVTGKILDSNGIKQYSIDGFWNKYMQVTNIQNKQIQKIVERYELPKDSKKMYNFTKFAINLNNLTEEQVKTLPPTDCRFRPDLRAYEYGDIDLAAKEKHRLEESQRSRRAQLKKENRQWKPLWFDFEMEGKEVKKWKYKGQYWQIKEQGNWPIEMLDLYN